MHSQSLLTTVLQITVVMPGAFRTNAANVADSYIPPNSHPAYTDLRLPSVSARNGITTAQAGDVHKAVKLIRKLNDVAEPPLFLPLGNDAVAMYDNKVELYSRDLEETKKHWNEDLELEGGAPNL